MFGYCGSMGVGGWLLMIGLWAGFVAVVVWAVSRLFPLRTPRSEAEDLLRHRLAAGEIDPKAYREARDELVGASRR